MTKVPYDYKFLPKYDRTVFAKLVLFFTKSIDSIKESKHFEDPLYKNQFQTFKTTTGEITSINDFMVSAFWVESKVNLDDILKRLCYDRKN